MSTDRIELSPKSIGERWLQYTVNSASKWASLFSLLLGIAFTSFYFASPSNAPILFVALGPAWFVLALLHQERFLARRVIERILKDSMIETQKPVEQYVPPKSDRAGG